MMCNSTVFYRIVIKISVEKDKPDLTYHCLPYTNFNSSPRPYHTDRKMIAR